MPPTPTPTATPGRSGHARTDSRHENTEEIVENVFSKIESRVRANQGNKENDASIADDVKTRRQASNIPSECTFSLILLGADMDLVRRRGCYVMGQKVSIEGCHWDANIDLETDDSLDTDVSLWVGIPALFRLFYPSVCAERQLAYRRIVLLLRMAWCRPVSESFVVPFRPIKAGSTNTAIPFMEISWLHPHSKNPNYSKPSTGNKSQGDNDTKAKTSISSNTNAPTDFTSVKASIDVAYQTAQTNNARKRAYKLAEQKWNHTVSLAMLTSPLNRAEAAHALCSSLFLHLGQLLVTATSRSENGRVHANAPRPWRRLSVLKLEVEWARYFMDKTLVWLNAAQKAVGYGDVYVPDDAILGIHDESCEHSGTSRFETELWIGPVLNEKNMPRTNWKGENWAWETYSDYAFERYAEKRVKGKTYYDTESDTETDSDSDMDAYVDVAKEMADAIGENIGFSSEKPGSEHGPFSFFEDDIFADRDSEI